MTVCITIPQPNRPQPPQQSPTPHTSQVVDWAAPMQELQLLTWQTFWKHLCMQADAATLTDIAARAIATKGAGDVWYVYGCCLSRGVVFVGEGCVHRSGVHWT